MSYPTIKVKKAYITKQKNPFYKELHYDYFLRLDEKMYQKMINMELPVKNIINRITGESEHFINVTPAYEPDRYNPYKKISAPKDEEFLTRDDVDITFTVYIKDFHGKEIKKLYFSDSDIEVKGDKE